MLTNPHAGRVCFNAFPLPVHVPQERPAWKNQQLICSVARGMQNKCIRERERDWLFSSGYTVQWIILMLNRKKPFYQGKICSRNAAWARLQPLPNGLVAGSPSMVVNLWWFQPFVVALEVHWNLNPCCVCVCPRAGKNMRIFRVHARTIARARARVLMPFPCASTAAHGLQMRLPVHFSLSISLAFSVCVVG